MAPAQRASINEILSTNRLNSLAMFKKLLLGAAIVVGLIYGSGNDFASVKHQIMSGSNENARGLTAGDNKDWGSDSGY